jgi:hypothetical protein
MSESGPTFYAWSNEAQRIEAFAASISALKLPGAAMKVSMDSETRCQTERIDEAVAMMRAHFFGLGNAHASFCSRLKDSGRDIWFGGLCYTEESERRRPSGPIGFWVSDSADFFPFHVDLALGSDPRSVEAEACVAWLAIDDDLIDLLLRVCAPDASGRVPTGACTMRWSWDAPANMCATYNASADDIARDLALTWVHLHDNAKVERAAGLSLSALHARVDAAPRGARVAPKGAGQRSLSRETVLKALATPPSALLQALDAAAVPDDAWRAAEPRAREIIEQTSLLADSEEGPPAWHVDLTTKTHVRFLEEHAAYRVQRLPDGGVVLATHPYRSLWPLWADALFALGLTS